jgi:2-dehydropantoate 2-reductase
MSAQLNERMCAGAYRTGDFSVMHCGQGSFVAGQPCQQLVAAAAAEAASQASSSSSASSTSTAAGLQGMQKQQSAVGTTAGVLAQQQRRQQNVQEMLSLLGSLQQLQPDTTCSPEQLQQQLLLKLLINCCSNPLSGLLHCRNGGLPGNPYAEEIWRHIIAECKAVFGDQLPGNEQELFERVSHVVELNSQNYNSMLQDVMRRGPTEIEYLNGFVVPQGAAAGVATPYNEMLAQLMRARTAVPHALLTNESL